LAATIRRDEEDQPQAPRRAPQEAPAGRREAPPGRSGRRGATPNGGRRAEAEYRAARAAFAAAVERDQLATVPDFDREWWTSFGLDFFDCQFGEAGEVDGVAYEAHDAHAFEWVRLWRAMGYLSHAVAAWEVMRGRGWA
jgi:hypothetical protein